jgi:DNA topoisomerase I
VANALIIVESPNKVKELRHFLPSGYHITASLGHVRDLPTREYGIDTATWNEAYETIQKKADKVRELQAARKKYAQIIIGTDDDREGEAIGWHLCEILRLDPATTPRLVFREITQKGVDDGFRNMRTLALPRVDAGRARRAIDRVLGFDTSREICWPAGAESAGRVQTPALHLIAERERQILGFVSEAYSTLTVEYAEGFSAYVWERIGTKAGEEEEDDERPIGEADPQAAGGASGRLRPKWFRTRADADAAMAEAKKHPHVIRDIERRRTHTRPESAYTTSTLVQDAARKLRLDMTRVSELAQELFERGKITYHRTDSTRISDDAVAMHHAYVTKVAPASLPTGKVRRGAAGAQDAHEAIRPTALENDESDLAGDALALYQMIKARFLAALCKPADFDKTTAWIDSGPIGWVAQGSILVDKGFLVFWAPYARTEDVVLPALNVPQTLTPGDYTVEDKKTQPPSRYDQGGLVKKLETVGIGRPSTYMQGEPVKTLMKRGYIEELAMGRKKVLKPTDFGMKVDDLMANSFPTLVAVEYTADMEASLDGIEAGGVSRTVYLDGWYTDFRAKMTAALPQAAAYRHEHGLRAKPRGASGEETTKTCDRCGEAKYRKIARTQSKGNFLSCPSCGMTRDVSAKVKPGGCGTCGSALIEKKSVKTGESFYGCVRYGAAERPCDFIEGRSGAGSSGSGGGWSTEKAGKNCLKCGKQELILRTPSTGNTSGSAHYACPDRGCGFTLTKGFLKRQADCPDCRAAVVERRRRQSDAERVQGKPPQSFWGCVRYPECKYTAEMSRPTSP